MPRHGRRHIYPMKPEYNPVEKAVECLVDEGHCKAVWTLGGIQGYRQDRTPQFPIRQDDVTKAFSEKWAYYWDLQNEQ